MSGIVDWLKSISESIVQIPLNLWNYIKDIPGQVWEFFENSFSTLTSVFKNTYDFVITIPEKIFEGIKSIFVPDTDKIQSSIDRLKEVAKSKFGVETVDLSGIMGVGTEITNHSGTVEILGYSFTADFLDVRYLVSAVATFRPYVRGFIVLLIFLYNINQFLHFIGAGGLSLGANIVTRMSSGGDKNDN